MGEERSPRSNMAGMAFAGSVLAGIGLGAAFGRSDLGTLIGIGVGLVLMALLKNKS